MSVKRWARPWSKTLIDEEYHAMAGTRVNQCLGFAGEAQKPGKHINRVSEKSSPAGGNGEKGE